MASLSLEEFLVEAKINTYASASGGQGSEETLEDGGKKFVYEEGKWRYWDRYFGSHRFTGQEIVWQNGRMVWTMNYYGGIVSEKASLDEVYGFLKKALGNVTRKKPFRGPLKLWERKWLYLNMVRGSVDSFHGLEQIIYQGQEKVYELRYHGGRIG